MKTYCTHCKSNSLRVDYQPRWGKSEDGEWYDRGGHYIATCDNPECSVRGYTTVIQDHPTLDERYKRKRS